MEVLNLVFNRLGNSVSILIDYPEVQIQLLDSIHLYANGIHREIKGLSVGKNLTVDIQVSCGSVEKNSELVFTERGVEIPEVGQFKPIAEGFLSTDTELLFKVASNSKTAHLNRGDGVFLHQEGFFTSVGLLLCI
ncbi:MAG: hypothetical protein GXO45_05655 [Aquificae bacterium]|nr:hypothetical protein [Aquificota bacterium]